MDSLAQKNGRRPLALQSAVPVSAEIMVQVTAQSQKTVHARLAVVGGVMCLSGMATLVALQKYRRQGYEQIATDRDSFTQPLI